MEGAGLPSARRPWRSLAAAIAAALYAWPSASAGIMDPPAMPGIPKAPYIIKCFQDHDLVIVEDLAAKPVWRDGQWQGRSWTGDPTRVGAEILVQPGGNATCMVKQNER